MFGRRQSVQDPSQDIVGTAPRWRLWIPAALCAGAFVGDFATPLGVADAFTYILAVATCLWVRSRRAAYATAVAGTVLLAGGLWLAHGNQARGAPIAELNRVIGVLLIWIVAALVSWYLRVDENLQRSREAFRWQCIAAAASCGSRSSSAR
jgi:hypothetical protein